MVAQPPTTLHQDTVQNDTRPIHRNSALHRPICTRAIRRRATTVGRTKQSAQRPPRAFGRYQPTAQPAQTKPRLYQEVQQEQRKEKKEEAQEKKKEKIKKEEKAKQRLLTVSGPGTRTIRLRPPESPPPPTLRPTQSFSDSPGTNTRNRFGISWGTWGRASLKRIVNSHDFSAIEIWLTQEIKGKFRTIPTGTLLSGNHRLNQQTQRLSININRAVTPDGKEFRLNATIYDLRKQDGLQGYTTTPTPSHTQEALAAGVQAATSSILKQIITPVNPLAAGIAATGNSLIQNQTKKKPKPKINIRVDPQDVYLRMDDSL